MNNYQKKKPLKNRRGLSNIVTSAIMLSAVTVMGLLIVVWANTNLNTHQQSLDSTISSNFNKINEKMLIEHVWFNRVGPVINMTFNNVGTVGLNVTSVQITNVTSGQIYSFIHTDAGIAPDDTISLTENFGWIASTPYNVLITSGRNTQFETQVVSP